MKTTIAKRKPKIRTRNKSYSFKDSPLYNLQSKKKLSELLYFSLDDIRKAADDKDNYEIVEITQGSGKKRTLEVPDQRLDVLHTRIASLICRLAAPEYLHSGIKGKSSVTNAKEHRGSHSVLTTDIKAFYQSTKKKSIFRFFNSTMKCSPDVSRLLGDVCTYDDHIPTGSRISMPLAYWANHKFFDAMYRLSLSRDITMTVYVDDLTFSGEKVNELFRKAVNRIFTDYGFLMHPEKTTLYSGVAKKLITGVIVSGDELKVRNRHHKMAYEQLNEWMTEKNSIKKEELKLLLVSRYSAMGMIESKFKDKAITLIKATKTKLGPRKK